MSDMHTYIICDVSLKCFVVYIQEVFILLNISKVYVCLLHHGVGIFPNKSCIMDPISLNSENFIPSPTLELSKKKTTLNPFT